MNQKLLFNPDLSCKNPVYLISLKPSLVKITSFKIFNKNNNIYKKQNIKFVHSFASLLSTEANSKDNYWGPISFKYEKIKYIW